MDLLVNWVSVPSVLLSTVYLQYMHKSEHNVGIVHVHEMTNTIIRIPREFQIHTSLISILRDPLFSNNAFGKRWITTSSYLGRDGGRGDLSNTQKNNPTLTLQNLFQSKQKLNSPLLPPQKKNWKVPTPPPYFFVMVRP